MTTATAPKKKLSADQARRLHDAEVSVKQLEAQLEEARTRRTELRTAAIDRIPLSDDVDERAKGIRKAVIGGVRIRVSPAISGETFSLKAFKELGHEITAAMRDAISAGKPYDRWTVTPAAGPKKIGAVEPR